MKEVDKTSSPRAGRRKLDGSDSPSDLIHTKDALHLRGVFHAGISSTADVQGRALRPGSTPGAPLQYRLLVIDHQSGMIGGFLMQIKYEKAR